MRLNEPVSPVLSVHRILPANLNGRDWVCSDLHGHLPKLLEQLRSVKFNPLSDRLILLGDLIDRGPHSYQTLQWVLTTPWCHSVIGNHELMLWAAVQNPELTSKRLAMGGAWTHSLDSEELRILAEAVQTHFPLSYSVPTDIGMIGLVHSQSPVDDWNEMQHIVFSESLAKCCTWAWSRAYQHGEYIQNVEAVVSGHIGTDKIVIRGNQLWIDTLERTGQPTLLSAKELLDLVRSR
ncbi:metallophosphoesterase [Halopseudomonas pelagia]|uniref:Calcineurin-like phosphoesterase domain-containing protein n=1 Tax=Halopseudomonas pelagia TaxID=553151 RepID=A0AA91Z7K1_9GAMM|nr:metallophosphoesterase [Halopseudomonas pelagia]PCD00967.1 hypothetical protein CO192_02675 [Halopseudomonas pelagia]QFY57607.1 hypothetical protein EAO82_15255 [Halopseudomonas pelagia]